MDRFLIRLFIRIIIDNVFAIKPKIHVTIDDQPPMINKLLKIKYSSSLVHDILEMTIVNRLIHQVRYKHEMT